MKLGRLCLVTAVGGMLEMYDFSIFMLFSRYIAEAFFPDYEPVSGIVSVALLFFTGYIARPVGGMLAGHFGDRYGRKLLFMLTIGGMSLSTLGIGLLPGYSQWGGYSVCLLVLLRVTQGVSLGGELPGSTTYAAEHAVPSRRGLITSIIIAAVTFGNVLGAGLGWWLTRVMSPEDMSAWGWRVPFFIGGIVGLLGLIARRRIEESPVFRTMIASRGRLPLPVKHLLAGHWRETCTGMIIVSVTATMISVLLCLPGYYRLSSGDNSISPFQLTTIGFLLYSVLTVPFGWLSDLIGRRRQILWGALMMLSVVVLCAWFESNEPGTILLLVVLIVTAGAVINGAYEAAVIELYPTSVRYSGVALSHNMGFVLFGGLTPLLLSSLEQAGYRIFPVLILIPVLLLVLMVIYRVPCSSLKPLEYL